MTNKTPRMPFHQNLNDTRPEAPHIAVSAIGLVEANTAAQPPPRKSRRLLSYEDLKTEKGIKWSRQWIRALIKAGKFPRPVNPGAATTDFVEDEIDAYIESLIAERDAVSS